MSEPTAAEIAWAAGLFEGEGSIVATGKTAAKLSIEMTDLDVLERFAQVVEAGAITAKTCTNKKPHWKDRYALQIYARDDVRRILVAFLPWLQSRRRAKAEAILARLQRNPGSHSRKTHCSKGHALSGTNVYHWPRQPQRRKCRTCHRDNARSRYRSKARR